MSTCANRRNEKNVSVWKWVLLKNKTRSGDSGVYQVQKVNNEKMYTTLNTTDNNNNGDDSNNRCNNN